MVCVFDAMRATGEALLVRSLLQPATARTAMADRISRFKFFVIIIPPRVT